eukprot:6136448-Pleurochrysis_carterae.AAC.1
MTQAEAASLCSKLGFVSMWTWGRFGRAVMQPIMRRQTSKQGIRVGLGQPIEEAPVDFLTSILPRLPRRVLQLRKDPRPTVKIWTDAMWERTAEAPAGLDVGPPYAQRRMERSAVRACIAASAPRSASAFRAEQPVYWATRTAGGGGSVLHVRARAER